MFRLVLTAFCAWLVATPCWSLSFGVKGGLDGSTRRFLERYPATVREEFIKALEQALPLLDKSVDTAFDRIDFSVEKATDRLQCTLETLPPIAGSAADRVVREVLNKPSGNTATSNLLRFAENRREKINGSTSPTWAFARYTDVIATVREVRCRFSGVPDLVLAIDQLSISFFESHDTWKYIKEIDCDTANNCYGLLYRDTVALIGASDPRDVVATNAKVRIEALPKPGIRLSGDGFERVGSARGSRLPLKDYEADARELRSIQLGIAFESLKRADAAMKMLDGYAVQLAGAENAYASIIAGYGSNNSRLLRVAVLGDGSGMGPAETLESSLKDINFDQVLATSDAEEVNVRVAKMRGSRDSQLAAVKDIRAGFESRLNSVLAYEAELARRQRLAEEAAARVDRRGGGGPPGGGCPRC
ncbi:MAG: hypothetical protein GC203_09525 [Phenylobacterium sp.]|uniref:hypothetical protein n=1 Tax=Phenylobacterium sp. TaxID=1871053 RepID=UPI0025CCA947|nr:hypothetical protein [Phenylobacterium sp.]MBI1198092.1 hypothetical protein [Phenylobacterium sp.]